MNAEIIAKYLTQLKNKTDLSYEDIGKLCNKSESTVKGLCFAKTDNPGIDTVAPIVYALGGSIDEMYNPDKSKDEIKETSVLAMKDIYESQLTAIKESYDEQINNIRGHYEQHHDDLKENYEKRLADKRELIETKNAHIKSLEKESCSHKIAFWICISILVGILILEVMNPNLGWIRY